MEDDDLDRETVLVSQSSSTGGASNGSSVASDKMLVLTKTALRIVTIAREGDTKGFVGLVRDLKPVLSSWKDSVRADAERDKELAAGCEQVEKALSELLQACKLALSPSASDTQKQEAARQGKRLAVVIQSWKSVYEAALLKKVKSPRSVSPAPPSSLGKVIQQQIVQKPSPLAAAFAAGAERAASADSSSLFSVEVLAVKGDWMTSSEPSLSAQIRGFNEKVQEVCKSDPVDVKSVCMWTDRLLECVRLSDPVKQAVESMVSLQITKSLLADSKSEEESAEIVKILLEDVNRLVKGSATAKRRRAASVGEAVVPLSISEEEQDDPDWIKFFPDGSLRCASVNQLIYRLVDSDEHFLKVFFDTFHTFVSSEVLFDKLQERFLVASVKPQQMSAVLMAWIHGSFDEWDVSLVESCREWLRKKCEAKMAEKLLQTISKSLGSFNACLLDEVKVSFMGGSMSGGQLNAFVMLEGQAMVEQLCLVCGDLFRTLSLRHLTGGNWIDSALRHKADSVVRWIDFQVGLTLLVQNTILSEPSLRTRQKTVRKWIKVLANLLELHNYCGAFCVVEGLQSSSVSRLKHSFALIPPKEMRQLLDASRILSHQNSFARLETVLLSLVAEDVVVVPHLGRVLSNVMFAWQALPDGLTEGLVNWKRLQMLSQAVSDVSRFRGKGSYEFERVELATMYLMSLITANPFKASEDQLMEMSFSIEPRGIDKGELVQ